MYNDSNLYSMMLEHVIKVSRHQPSGMMEYFFLVTNRHGAGCAREHSPETLVATPDVLKSPPNYGKDQAGTSYESIESNAKPWRSNRM
jgi:hypothetical protein